LPADDDGRPIHLRLGVDHQSLKPLDALRHQLTHIQMTIQPLIGYAHRHSSGVECTPDQRWFGQREWPALGLPQPVRYLLETYLENKTND
jgi:adenine-specific DNA glycosylase